MGKGMGGGELEGTICNRGRRGRIRSRMTFLKDQMTYTKNTHTHTETGHWKQITGSINHVEKQLGSGRGAAKRKKHI